MDIKELNNRIQAKQEKIEKIKKKISKLEASKSDEGFKKRYSWMAKDGKWFNHTTGKYELSLEQFKDFGNSYQNYIKDVDYDIKRANDYLADAEITLNKYYNALDLAKSKEDKLSMDKIKVIWDFLQKWKQDYIKYIESNVEVLHKYFDKNSEYVNMANSSYGYIRTHSDEEGEAYKQKLSQLKKECGYLNKSIDPITRDVYSRKTGGIDYTKLNKILDKEVEAKYLYMIDRVTKITGNITDATGLYIDPKGNINGIIIGDMGKARLNTVYAGGYNDDIIVNERHGQVLHFRTLVHKVK